MACGTDAVFIGEVLGSVVMTMIEVLGASMLSLSVCKWDDPSGTVGRTSPLSISISVFVSSGMDSKVLEAMMGPDVMRSFGSRSFDGERERERARVGEGGGFLRSRWGTENDEGKRGTERALPLSAGMIGGERASALEEECGFFEPEAVAARLRVSFNLLTALGSEKLRAWVGAARLLNGLTSRLTRLSSRPSGGEPERDGYSPCGGGDAPRLTRVPLFVLRGDKSSSSSVPAAPPLSISKEESPTIVAWFLSAVRASFNGDPWDNCRMSSGSVSCDLVRFSLTLNCAMGVFKWTLVALTCIEQRRQI